VNAIGPHIAGMAIAFGVLISIALTMYWMLHPPTTVAERAAKVVQRDLEELIGSIIVVFSEEIHSDHMMALAVRLAHRERAVLLAAYVMQVPLTLPIDAEMEIERRQALGTLANAEAIARAADVEISTEIIPARSVSQGVVDLAKRRAAHLIILGAYREGKYSGAPLGREIEQITAMAQCDVLIGVQGRKGRMLTPPTGPQARARA
jgi:nucleotide-binding universal stress UspA family protein